MIESRIDFVYDSEGLEYDPHPREINKCYDKIVESVKNVKDIFPSHNLTQREIAVLKTLEPLFESIKKYGEQVDFTVGYLEGYLETETEWNDKLLSENIEFKSFKKRLKNILKKSRF